MTLCSLTVIMPRTQFKITKHTKNKEMEHILKRRENRFESNLKRNKILELPDEDFEVDL